MTSYLNPSTRNGGVEQIIVPERQGDNIDGKVITGNVVNGAEINGSEIIGSIITGTLMRTAASGARWEFSGEGTGALEGLRGYSGLPDELAPGGMETTNEIEGTDGLVGFIGALRMYAPKPTSNPAAVSEIRLISGGTIWNEEAQGGGGREPGIELETSGELSANADSVFLRAEKFDDALGGAAGVTITREIDTAEGYLYRDPANVTAYVYDRSFADEGQLQLEPEFGELTVTSGFDGTVAKVRAGFHYSASDTSGTLRRTNLIPHPGFLDGMSASWSAVGTGTAAPALYNDAGRQVMRVALGTAAGCGFKHRVSVTAGRAYTWRIALKAAAGYAGTAERRLRWLTSASAVISTDVDPISNDALVNYGYVTHSGKVTAPANAAFLELEVVRPAAGPAGEAFLIEEAGIIDVPVGDEVLFRDASGNDYFDEFTGNQTFPKQDGQPPFELQYWTASPSGTVTERKVILDQEQMRAELTASGSTLSLDDAGVRSSGPILIESNAWTKIPTSFYGTDVGDFVFTGYSPGIRWRRTHDNQIIMQLSLKSSVALAANPYILASGAHGTPLPPYHAYGFARLRDGADVGHVVPVVYLTDGRIQVLHNAATIYKTLVGVIHISLD